MDGEYFMTGRKRHKLLNIQAVNIALHRSCDVADELVT